MLIDADCPYFEDRKILADLNLQKRVVLPWPRFALRCASVDTLAEGENCRIRGADRVRKRIYESSYRPSLALQLKDPSKIVVEASVVLHLKLGNGRLQVLNRTLRLRT